MKGRFPHLGGGRVLPDRFAKWSTSISPGRTNVSTPTWYPAVLQEQLQSLQFSLFSRWEISHLRGALLPLCTGWEGGTDGSPPCQQQSHAGPNYICLIFSAARGSSEMQEGTQFVAGGAVLWNEGSGKKRLWEGASHNSPHLVLGGVRVRTCFLQHPSKNPPGRAVPTTDRAGTRTAMLCGTLVLILQDYSMYSLTRHPYLLFYSCNSFWSYVRTRETMP